jgi:hypothetical protein
MKQHQEDEIIAKHRRKKGKKPFVIQRKMTASEAYRRIQEEYTRIMREHSEWDTTFTKYETEQQASQALGDIEKKKAHDSGFNHHRGFDHRIIDTREAKADG